MSLPMIIKTLNEKKKNKIVTTMSKLANKILRTDSVNVLFHVLCVESVSVLVHLP